MASRDTVRVMAAGLAGPQAALSIAIALAVRPADAAALSL